MRDIRYAFRLLTRKPGFAALALTTLVLGIGASTAMFTVLDQVVLRPLPYGAPEELVFVNETSMDGTQTYSVSIPNFFDWRERTRTLASLSAYRAANFNYASGEGVVRVRGAQVSGNFFATLQATPRIGTGFESDGEMAVMLSHGRQLGARSHARGLAARTHGRTASNSRGARRCRSRARRYAPYRRRDLAEKLSTRGQCRRRLCGGRSRRGSIRFEPC